MKNEINHICPKCNFHIKTSVEKHINSCDGRGPRRKIKRGKAGGWNKDINYIEKLGTNWYTDYVNKLSNGVKESYIRGDRREANEQMRREKISKKMKEVGGGYRKGSGRGKKGRYKGYWCDSSWELAWVIYNIDHGIKFERNSESFKYNFQGKDHKYYPDFKIDDTFFEIKGYITEQSVSKLESFKNKIELIDKNKIKLFLKYVIEKYGKDFIRLYD